jgi:hypothetical protein
MNKIELGQAKLTTVIDFEDVCDDARTGASILVSDEQTCTVIDVGAVSSPQDANSSGNA